MKYHEKFYPSPPPTPMNKGQGGFAFGNKMYVWGICPNTFENDCTLQNHNVKSQIEMHGFVWCMLLIIKVAHTEHAVASKILRRDVVNVLISK